MVVLWLIPMTIASLAALLVLTESLERRTSAAMVRMAIRSRRSTPEATESLVALELGRRLEAAGLGRRPVAAVTSTPEVAPHVAEAVLALEV